MKKIFRWIKKLIPKGKLPSSGNTITMGMTNYERHNDPKTTVISDSNKNTTQVSHLNSINEMLYSLK